MTDVGLSLADLKGNPRRLRREAIVRALFFAAAATSVLVSALIVLSLVREAWTFMTQVVWNELWNEGWYPRRGQYNVVALFASTLLVTGIGMIVAVPIGMGAAIFLSEYAGAGTRRILKPVLEILAGIPSVVLGFFALTFISPEIVQRFSSDAPTFNRASAGIAVGILTIPLIASVAEDAMRSVPMSLREASFGLGARKITTSVRVVLPAAVSGLVAAFIVATSRAIGETMVVFIAGGLNGELSWSPTDPGTTMTAAMAQLAAGTDSVVGEALTFQSLFFVGLLLFTVTLVLNIVADRFVRRVRQQY